MFDFHKIDARFDSKTVIIRVAIQSFNKSLLCGARVRFCTAAVKMTALLPKRASALV
jgi:hypothetical protein